MDFSDQYELVEVSEVMESAPIPGIRSESARKIAKWFGIEGVVREKRQTASSSTVLAGAKLAGYIQRVLIPKGGEIVLLTGPSGAGKSSMLREMRSVHVRGEWVDLNEVCLPEMPVVDCFSGMELEEVLAVLSRVGLAEAWSYLRFPSELSEGQRWRLRLAMGMNAKPQAAKRGRRIILVADEFAALLDRVTAAIVARCLRRAIDSTSGLCAVVATSHEDLVGALNPDVIVRCDFRRVEIWRRGLSKNRMGRRIKRNTLKPQMNTDEHR